MRLAIAGFARECAIAATIPAKVRQRNKDLARIRDHWTGARVTNGARLFQEIEQFPARGANQPTRIGS